MPKVTFEFNLPEEQDEYKTMSKANNYYRVLWDFSNHMRSLVKYTSDDYSDEQLDMVERLREVLHEKMDDHEVSGDF